MKRRRTKENNYQEKIIQDLETIISTNEAYKQHGKVTGEKGSKSQSSSQRDNTPKQHTQNIVQDNKILQSIIQGATMILIMVKIILNQPTNYQLLREKGIKTKKR
jgi:hypothetical protein